MSLKSNASNAISKPLLVNFCALQGDRLLVSTTFKNLNNAISNLASYAYGYTGDGVDSVNVNLITNSLDLMVSSGISYVSNYKLQSEEVFLFLIDSLEVRYSGDSRESEFLNYHLSANAEPLIPLRYLKDPDSLSISDSGAFCIKNKDVKFIVAGISDEVGFLRPVSSHRSSLLRIPESLLLVSFCDEKKWKIKTGVLPLYLAYDSNQCIFPKTYFNQ